MRCASVEILILLTTGIKLNPPACQSSPLDHWCIATRNGPSRLPETWDCHPSIRRSTKPPHLAPPSRPLYSMLCIHCWLFSSPPSNTHLLPLHLRLLHELYSFLVNYLSSGFMSERSSPRTVLALPLLSCRRFPLFYDLPPSECLAALLSPQHHSRLPLRS